MAGSSLEAAISLLFLASSIQGFKKYSVIHNETMEAVWGQNISMTCILNTSQIDNVSIISTEWSKGETGSTKLALYSPNIGYNQFEPNISFQKINNGGNFIGSSLELFNVGNGDKGVYICNFATFPYGSISTKINLQIKELSVMCDKVSPVEVTRGENVTIRCTSTTGVQYRWTKDGELVSEMDSLELWKATDTSTGVYTLTVNNSQASLEKEFVITVRTTTDLRMEPMTVTPHNARSLEPLTDTTATPAATGFSTTDSRTVWTKGPEPVTVTPHNAESPESLTDTNSTAAAHGFSTTDSVYFQTKDEGGTMFRTTWVPHTNPPGGASAMTTQETSSLGNSSKVSGNPSATPSPTTANTKVGIKSEANQRTPLPLVFIITSILLFIIVAGIIYRRHILKQRMDLPPPFKPPPPPVKYTTSRQKDIQMIPISLCESTDSIEFAV